MAYLAIPFVLVYFVRRRRDLPFSWIFIMFGAFIIGCGFTHFMEVVTFHTPLYRLSGLVKLLTALVSWATVIALVPLVPKALALRAPSELENEIRERKEVEEALRASEARARLLLDTALSAFVTIDAAGSIIEWNRQAETTFGWSKEEMLGRPMVEMIVPPQHRIAHMRGLQHFLATGEGPVLNRRIEMTALHRDGHEFAVELAIAPLRLGQDFVFTAFVRDISERNRAEEALRDSERRLAGILGIAEDAIISVDGNQRIVLFNQGAEKAFGYTAAEILGRSLDELLPLRYVDVHRKHMADFARSPQAARKMGERNEVFARRKDGIEFPAEASISKLELEHERVFTVMLRDITARRQAEDAVRDSERRLAGILDIAEDAIISVDGNQRIILFNQGAEKAFGYAASEILGRPLDVLLPPRHVDVHRKHMADFARSPLVARKMGERSEVFARRKDGTEFPAEASISKLQLKEETVFTVMLRDITARKQAEAAIRQLNEELEQRVTARTAELAEANRDLAHKNQENEMFVYSVSHDLRSPLVNLQGFSRELGLAAQNLQTLLASDDVPPSVRDRALTTLDSGMAKPVKYITSAVVRLGSIIDALLRLSRVGRVTYQRQMVDIQAVVDRVIDSLKDTIDQQGTGVRVTELPPAWGDPTALEQVFANLIGNALKYLDPSRPGRIEVGCTDPRPSETGPVYFVKDNGRGIPPEYHVKIFRAFQRLSPGSVPGEGMGLAIVQRVIERHQGKVWVESVEGRGSTFYLSLPPAPENAASTGGASETRAVPLNV